jgi:hypothetical protein
MNPWLAALCAACFTALIAGLLIVFANYLWPLMPAGLKLLVCILAGILGIGGPIYWWAQRSNEMLKRYINKDDQ